MHIIPPVGLLVKKSQIKWTGQPLPFPLERIKKYIWLLLRYKQGYSIFPVHLTQEPRTHVPLPIAPYVAIAVKVDKILTHDNPEYRVSAESCIS